MHEKPLQTKELQIYSFLRGRMDFTVNDQLTYQNLHKGFVGEKKFYKLAQQHLTCSHLALYDILLENKGTLYQIDSLFIFPKRLVLNEVKYFQGEFELKDDCLFDVQKQKEYRNPLHQLKRSTIFLRELLLKLRVNLPVQPQLVFNHDQFTLFHAKPNTPIILPTQLHSYLHQLNQTPDTIHQHHYTLADQIKKNHIPESPYMRVPTYKYDTLRKGVLCRDCREKMMLRTRTLFCPSCAYREFIDSGILRSVSEFHTLFPNQKIKTGVIADLCALPVSRKTITRILNAYLKLYSNARGSHYHFH